MKIESLLIALCAVAASNAVTTLAHAANSDAAARCESVARADFSLIEDAPTQIISAQPVGPTAAMKGYCEVDGYVAPSFEFLLRLPENNWNGKLLEEGCGGTCGSPAMRALVTRCDDPLRRGYACIISNGGHTGNGVDSLWAYNNPQAWTDFWAQAPHVIALAGKAIVKHYYGQSPHRAYFWGCSAGGIQGLSMAQNFPWDFDGIVAGAPIARRTDLAMSYMWVEDAFLSHHGEPPLLGEAEMRLLHQAVLEKCDMNDGIKDGLIGDPRMCRFHPAELRCSAYRSSSCLSDQQVTAVEKVYVGPVTSGGEQIAPPQLVRGSELNWIFRFTGSYHTDYPDFLRYHGFRPNPGPAWKRDDLDFDHDYKRLGMAQIAEPRNPDLRRLKAAGAKLLMFEGWNDSIGVLQAVDYYEIAERVIGGRAAAQDFMRLFMVPGMNHCGLTEGGDSVTAVDYLSYLEAWVEEGQAPDKLIASYMRGTFMDGLSPKFPLDSARVEFSRPVYPYPIKTIYSGRGDPRSADSFRSEAP